MSGSRAKRILRGTLVYLAIIVVTLVVVDVICMVTGLFPPTYNYGDPDLGWRPARATGAMAVGKCEEFSTGQVILYQRNEDGVRTGLSRAQQQSDSGGIRIAITGDSQTDLCAPNDQTHAGVLEGQLRSQGLPATVLAYGSGRYSPLQDYLAFRTILKPYHPRVLVINLYTGNDFYDILRVDDRPHFVAGDSGYRIAPPVWFLQDDPAVKYHSRVLYAIRTVADKTGLRRLYFRLTELRRLGNQQGGSLGDVFAYMKDLWKAREPSVGYSDAFSAQILNQQLFFLHFPASAEASIQQIKTLMELIRKENPSLITVMSPLPSYQLVGGEKVDSIFLKTLARLPISYAEGQAQELALYQRLRGLSSEQGWIFVDNLAALREYHGGERLYNNFDYHLLPIASAIVGRAQAAAMADSVRAASLRLPNH